MKKVGIILPSEFRRLPLHVGALYAWSHFLPKPDVIIGCSAGAIAGASCLPWSEENFKKISEIIRNLKTRQIYSMLPSLEALLALGGSAALLPFIDLNEAWSKKKKILIPAIAAGILGIDAFTFNQFMKRESLFSNEPLKHLLLKNLDFEAIFNSDIDLSIVSTDMETSEEVIFTNYLEEDRFNNEKLVSGILASSRLAGRFTPRITDGKFLGDAAILGNAPLDLAAEQDCDVVFVFLFSQSKEKRNSPKTFIGDIIVASQITEAELTRFQIENFKLRAKLGEKLPEVFVIESQQPFADLNFRNFDSVTMTESLSIGYDSLVGQLPQMCKLIQK